MFTLAHCPALVLSLLLGAAGGLVQAKDAYFDIPVHDLKLVEGKLPEPGGQTDWRHYERSRAMQPYAVARRRQAKRISHGPAHKSNGEYSEYG